MMSWCSACTPNKFLHSIYLSLTISQYLWQIKRFLVSVFMDERMKHILLFGSNASFYYNAKQRMGMQGWKGESGCYALIFDFQTVDDTREGFYGMSLVASCVI